MIELIAFTQLLDLKRNADDRHPARAEDEFYRSFGQSRLERLAARLLSLRGTKKGRDLRDPSVSCADEPPVRQHFACGHDLQLEPHQSGIAGSAS